MSCELHHRIAEAHQSATLTCNALEALHRCACTDARLLAPSLRDMIAAAVRLQTRLHELKDLSLDDE